MELVKVLSDEELKVIQRSDDKEVVGEIIGFKDFMTTDHSKPLPAMLQSSLPQ